MDTQYAILGCGYTGRRVADRLVERGLRVLATVREPERLRVTGVRVIRMVCEEEATVEGLRAELEPGCRVLYSIPLGMERLASTLRGVASRVVYLSTTGVYGAQKVVNEETAPEPRTPRELRRAAQERAAMDGEWSWMVLRAAAIYGPGRGVHVSMAEGTHQLIGDGDNYVSRIHVDDLAAFAEAALLSDVGGAWPVADDEPCRAREIAAYCAELLGLPMPGAGVAGPEDTRLADRRVDGRGVRDALGVTLRYPSYRVGIPAALREGR